MGRWSQASTERYEFRKNDPDDTLIGEVFKERAGYRGRYRTSGLVWKLISTVFETAKAAQFAVEGMLDSPDVARR
jgi:hypothetical protein